MLEEYVEHRLDLGSIQYLSIAEKYSKLVDGIEKPKIDIQNIIERPNMFRIEMEETFEAFYRLYMALYHTPSFKKLDTELKDEIGIYDEDHFEELKEKISTSPFKFPVKPRQDTNLIKIAIMEWFNFLRNSAFDLWSATNYLTSHLDSLDHSYDYSDNENIAEFLYLLREVYKFSDDEIQKIAGDFDT